MFHSTFHQENANESCNEVLLHTYYHGKKYEVLMTPNAREDMEQKKLSFTAGRNATFEDSSANSYKTKCILTM